MGIEASLGKVIQAVSEDSVLKNMSKELGSLNQLGDFLGKTTDSLGSLLREMDGKASKETMETFPSADLLLSTFAENATSEEK